MPTLMWLSRLEPKDRSLHQRPVDRRQPPVLLAAIERVFREHDGVGPIRRPAQHTLDTGVAGAIPISSWRLWRQAKSPLAILALRQDEQFFPELGLRRQGNAPPALFPLTNGRIEQTLSLCRGLSVVIDHSPKGAGKFAIQLDAPIHVLTVIECFFPEPDVHNVKALLPHFVGNPPADRPIESNPLGRNSPLPHQPQGVALDATRVRRVD